MNNQNPLKQELRPGPTISITSSLNTHAKPSLGTRTYVFATQYGGLATSPTVAKGSW